MRWKRVVNADAIRKEALTRRCITQEALTLALRACPSPAPPGTPVRERARVRSRNVKCALANVSNSFWLSLARFRTGGSASAGEGAGG